MGLGAVVCTPREAGGSKSDDGGRVCGSWFESSLEG